MTEINKKILVLLSTYNGELYLESQLNSILLQKEVDVYLLIRDDGSSDNTLCIIKSYIDAYPSKIFVEEGKNVGCAKSFRLLMELALNFCENKSGVDFFAFCDQDDIWKPEKLKIAVDRLSLLDDALPNLFFSQYQKIDSLGNELPTQMNVFKLTFGEALVMNPSVGCTQVFNRKLLWNALKATPPFLILHDWWIYIVCLALSGNVVYEKQPLVLYRQHERNVIGSKKISRFQKLKNWLYHKNNNQCSQLAKALELAYKKEMNDRNLKVVELVVKYREKLYYQLTLLYHWRYLLTYNKDVNIGFILSVLFRKF